MPVSATQTQHVLLNPTRPQGLALLLTQTDEFRVCINTRAHVCTCDGVGLKPQHSAGKQLLWPLWSVVTLAAARPRVSWCFQSRGVRSDSSRTHFLCSS